MIYHHSLESIHVYNFKHLPQHPHDIEIEEEKREYKCPYCLIVMFKKLSDEENEICPECRQSLKELK